MIRWYGRKDLGTGILNNRTEGGEGGVGYRHTEEAKKKIGDATRGKPGKTGYHTDEAKEKIRIAQTRRSKKPMSEDTKEKLRASWIGTSTGPKSEEIRMKMRVAAKVREDKKRSIRSESLDH